METETYYLKKYENSDQDIWDDLVINSSVNGTFLQTRRFLNYHEKNRFEDASYMLYNSKNHLVAVCPASRISDTNVVILFSHQGSTFGGLIIHEKYYCAHKVIAIIKAFEDGFVSEGYQRIVYKITSNLFSKRESDLLEYCLYYSKYKNYDELNLYVDLNNIKTGDILSNFSQGKRTNVHNCERRGLVVRPLRNDQEIISFHNLLRDTLAKYELKPVHTSGELIALKNHFIQKECDFYGAFLNEKMVAGSMMFYFWNIKVAHTQYLCADHEYDKLSPMTYMYYSMMIKMQEKGFQRLSWGITSEHLGKELNYGLTRSKESFGSKYSVSKVYMKDLM